MRVLSAAGHVRRQTTRFGLRSHVRVNGLNISSPAISIQVVKLTRRPLQVAHQLQFRRNCSRYGKSPMGFVMVRLTIEDAAVAHG